MDSTPPETAPGAAIPEFSRIVTLAEIGRGPETITATATPQERDALARRFGLDGLTALTLEATLSKWRGGVKVSGRIVAEAVQTSVSSLDPVSQHIDETFERGFLPDAEPFTDAKPGAEVEMPLDPELDDAPEPLGDRIDIGELAAEALALAIDPYPRGEDDGYLDAAAGPPGEAAMTDADAKPFASLAEYRRKLSDGDS